MPPIIFLCRSFPARAEGPFPRNQRQWFFNRHSGASTGISTLSSDPARLCGGKPETLGQYFARHDSSIMSLPPGSGVGESSQARGSGRFAWHHEARVQFNCGLRNAECGIVEKGLKKIPKSTIRIPKSICRCCPRSSPRTPGHEWGFCKSEGGYR